MFTKDNVGQPARADGKTLTDAERQKIADEWNANADAARVAAVLRKRREEYGTPEQQLEYAVENGGFDALVARNLAIKAKLPKPKP